MKNLKNTFAGIIMMGVLAFGTTFANAGIVIALTGEGDVKKETKPTVCEEPQSSITGIVIAFTDIILSAKTGIILTRVKDTTVVVNCGIVIA